MIDYETYSRIKHLHLQKGLTAMQISRELALDERTVKLWLAAKQYQTKTGGYAPYGTATSPAATAAFI